jgi:Ca2+-binding RTX toxin-like protein
MAVLLGSIGSDTLDGSGVEQDILVGGLGDDTYLWHIDFFDFGRAGECTNTGFDIICIPPDPDPGMRGDIIVEAPGGGRDRVFLYNSALVTVLVGENPITSITLNASLRFDLGGTNVEDAIARTGNSTWALRGSTADNLLVGNALADRLWGLTGDDTLKGGASEDSLYGGDGNDVLDGGTGNDLLRGGLGDDRLIGGDGDDTLAADAGRDTLLGGNGDDRLIPGAGTRLIDGGPGAFDTLVTKGPIRLDLGLSIISGDFGRARIVNVERVLVGNRADTLIGGASDDTLDGAGGADVVSGLDGDDFLFGGAGNDTLAGGDGNDTVSGGVGNDIIGGGLGDDSLTGDDGRDRLSGDAGNDTLVGDSDLSSLLTLPGSGHNDTLRGGDGDDLLIGLGGDDRLDGQADDDLLFGGEENDHLFGGTGNDTLFGGDGDDTLTGGAGNDRFEFGRPGEGWDGVTYDRDSVTDFRSGDDLLVIVSGGSQFVRPEYDPASGTIRTGTVTLATVTQADDDVLITYGLRRGSGPLLTTWELRLEDMRIEQLDPGDFVFPIA